MFLERLMDFDDSREVLSGAGLDAEVPVQAEDLDNEVDDGPALGEEPLAPGPFASARAKGLVCVREKSLT